MAESLIRDIRERIRFTERFLGSVVPFVLRVFSAPEPPERQLIYQCRRTLAPQMRCSSQLGREGPSPTLRAAILAEELHPVEGIHMSSVWLMSALDIQAEMQSAAKTKDKVIHVRVASAEEDLPLWVHRILEHSAWLEEG